MRLVYVAPRYVSNTGIYEVKEGAGVRQPAQDRACNLPYSEIQQQHEVRRQPLGDRDKACRRSVVKEERRKVSQRVMRKSVLLELRSRIDRRRRNQRESDIVVHIDEKT